MKLTYSDKLALIREYKNQGGKGSYLSLLSSYAKGGELPEKETIPFVSNYYNTQLAQPIDGINDYFRSLIIGKNKPTEETKLSPQEYMYSLMTSPKYKDLYLDNYYAARSESYPHIYNDSTVTKEEVKTDNFFDANRKNLDAVENSTITIDNSDTTNYNLGGKNIHVSYDLDALPHELAHSIPDNIHNLTSMYNRVFDNYIPRDAVQARLKEIVNSKEYPSTLDKAYNIDDLIRLNYKKSAGAHDISPMEVRSDIYDLRYKLYKSGVHDFRKDTFDNKTYNKALKQVEGTILERLFKAYSKEDLIELMNTVVDNTNKNDKTRQIS